MKIRLWSTTRLISYFKTERSGGKGVIWTFTLYYLRYWIFTRPAAGRNESPHRTGLVPLALALSSRHLGKHSTAIFINHENFLYSNCARIRMQCFGSYACLSVHIKFLGKAALEGFLNFGQCVSLLDSRPA